MNILPDIDVRGATGSRDLWYKDAILYQLHVKAFADDNNDGIGDFAGLTSRLDYLQDLGVTALWLLPFYPSPGRDDGYDIADYEQINSDFGTLDDFKTFLAEAKARGLKVITELVINHTSDQHPWFQKARLSPPDSDARNWYVWSQSIQKYAGTRIIFSDTEKSNWTWDPDAKAYYWHRFFSHQPDLNYDNPNVLKAMLRLMKKWADMGVDGFRLDAIPYLCEREGTSSENLPETHAVIKAIRKEIDSYGGGHALLAEANQWPEDVNAYFGDSDECHMAYHFPLMPRIYMAIAREDRFPIADIIRQTPDIPADCQWALFLRNHDELTLEMVTDVERDYLWSTYAADPRARINLGIRRRLAPLMDNDRRKIELMNSLLMSLPGTPIIYYGDEIGMGDNIYLGDRNGVRTPMQWTSERNGGFSKCDPARLYLPVIMDPIYGHQALNVEAQAHSVSSLLSWTKRLIAVRKSTRVFGRGSLTFVRPANRAVLCYVRQLEGEVILCIANLSRSAQAAELDLSAWKGRQPQEMLGRARFPRIGSEPYILTLPPYGFFWFALTEQDESQIDPRPPEFVTLVLNDGWKSLLSGRTRAHFEQDVLPAFLPGRRWFADKDQREINASVRSIMPLADDSREFLLTLVDTNAGGNASRYLLPLWLTWARFDRLGSDLSHVLATLRRGPREGALVDVAGQAEFITALLKRVHAGDTVTEGDQHIEFRATERFREMPPPSPEKIRVLEGEQSNTSAIIDDQFVIKIFRRLNPGIHPEIEVGRVLAASEFRNNASLLGSVELRAGDDTTALAVVHRFVENQGDAWKVTSGYLDRFLDEQRVMSPEAVADSPELASYLQRMQQIGRRTAELHVALAARDDLPDFAPEPVSKDDTAEWAVALRARLARMLQDLVAGRTALSASDQQLVEELAGRRDAILRYIDGLLPSRIAASKFRGHGDLHLGQILMVKDDVVILDFEGEPKRTLAERRAKYPAARDVAGVIRSIDYASTGAMERTAHIAAEERNTLAPKLDHWRERAASAFLAAYVAHATDLRLWPMPEDAARRVLDFYLLDKAVYEVGYELSNRPGWLHVPLAGLRRILANGGVL